MDRFYFDINDDSDLHRDPDGEVLPDAKAARVAALEILAGIVSETLTSDGDRRETTVDVRDETGRVVYTARVSLVARSFQ